MKRRPKPAGERRRERIMAFLRDYLGRHEFAPSFREIGEAVGLLNPANVGYHLDRLERLGRIRRTEGTSRSIVILDESESESESA